jgi:hypothetical protein
MNYVKGLPAGFTITQLEGEELRAQLANTVLLKNIGAESADSIELHPAVHYCMRFGKYSMLYVLIPKSKDIVEIHIACAKDSRVASRALCFAILRHLRATSTYKYVLTTCPEGTMSNLARKLGFVDTGARAEDKLCFAFDLQALFNK